MVDDEFLGVEQCPEQVPQTLGGVFGPLDVSPRTGQFPIVGISTERSQERLLDDVGRIQVGHLFAGRLGHRAIAGQPGQVRLQVTDPLAQDLDLLPVLGLASRRLLPAEPLQLLAQLLHLGSRLPA